MASSFSQDFIRADRLIKRKYVRIPQDQKKLLEGDGAWSENLSHGPHRMVNVPPQVIEDVKSFHSRKDALVTRQLLPVQPAPPEVAGIPLTPSRRKEPVASPAPGDNDEENDEVLRKAKGWKCRPQKLLARNQEHQSTELLYQL
ncbi:hypothetical protein VM1G_05931 [Cytospora mali]|uniref:Uncharacterized protein n=1 Tax=Cytospora mali TaxID=578113 RepID=A0A194W1B6_CYTMA|nr:hypothetical protein VM1G_05931 [Valsa mali]